MAEKKEDDLIIPLKESFMRDVIESLSMAEKAARHRASSSTGEANIFAFISLYGEVGACLGGLGSMLESYPFD